MPLLFYPRLFGNDVAVEGDAGGSPPAKPSLSILPNGDGTATGTISGSTTGSTNTIDVVGIGAGAGTAAWTNGGSRTGDGTITLTLANGSYLAVCESSLAGLPSLPSDPYSFAVTGGAAATTFNCPHAALAHSVQTKIQSLLGTRLTGIVADSVIVRLAPYGQDFTAPLNLHAMPGILIVYGDRERDLGGVNARDDIGYPLLIGFLVKSVTTAGVVDFESQDDAYLTWRQTVSDLFRSQQFTIDNYVGQNPLTFPYCDIDYGPIVDWRRLQRDQMIVGSFTLTFRLRKARG